MYCSKCGKELKEGESFCSNCGEMVVGEKGANREEHADGFKKEMSLTIHSCIENVVESIRQKRVNRFLYFSLLISLVVEWILVLLPVVEIGNSLFGKLTCYTFFDLQSGGFLELIIIVLHIVSIISLLIPLLTNREFQGRYFVPAIVTSAIVSIMFIRLTLEVDALITDTILGELLRYVTDGALLTGTSKGLITVSTISFLISTGMALSAGSEVKISVEQ